MKNTIKIGTATALAVACTAWLGGCHHRKQSPLIVLRSYVSTNLVPGYIGGQKQNAQVGPDGYLMQGSVNAIAINYPPKTNVVTNYVIGYRTADGESVEVLNVP